MIRSAAFLLCLASALYCADFRSAFDKSPDRPWIGAEYWSNPLQDWRVRNGRLENLDEGFIELQAHRRGYWVEYQRIRVRAL